MATKNGPENMSEYIRGLLKSDPSRTMSNVVECLAEDYPGYKANKGSLSVGFYTMRKKLGITSGRKARGKSQRKPIKVHRPVSIRGGTITGVRLSIDHLASAAKFVGEVGGFKAAIESVKQVQTVQVR